MPSNAVLTLAGARLQQPIVRVDLQKGFAKHSLCEVDVAYGRSLSSSAARTSLASEWTPTTLDLSNGGYSERWFGYVHTTGVVSDNRDTSGNGSVIRYTLLGTSLPMNTERVRAWRSTTDSGIVRSIGVDHRMRTVIQRTGEVLPYVAQSGTSDWKVLQERADRNGYRLYVDGSTLLFADPTLLLTGAKTSQIMTYRQDALNGQPDTLVKWNAKSGSGNSNAGQHVTYGLDTRTKKVLTGSATNSLVSGTPTLVKIDTSKRVSGVTQANQSASVNALRARSFTTATATVSGTPGMQPGDVVNIDGRNIPEDQQGLWLVTDVRHRLLNDFSAPKWPFLTDISLERDQYYSPTFRAQYKVINTADYVPAIIRNGVFWESETMEDVRIG